MLLNQATSRLATEDSPSPQPLSPRGERLFVPFSRKWERG